MSSYYDAFGSTGTDGPDDPFADELELERRDAEMEPSEPEYWDGLDDHSDVNVVTGEEE